MSEIKRGYNLQRQLVHPASVERSLTKRERLARKIEDREAYMLAIRKAIENNDLRDGDIGYRHSYDKALHVLVALDGAGFKIVRGQRK